MPFRYRLQKVLDFRENQKEEQRIQVQKAQKAVYKAEEDIKANNQAIIDTKEGMRGANPMMYEAYDNYLQHLWQKAEELEAIKVELQKKLDIELEKLVKCEQAVKVLEKHKQKSKEQFIQEEKAAELKQFSELGVTRFFKQLQQKNIEEEMELRKKEGN